MLKGEKNEIQKKLLFLTFFVIINIDLFSQSFEFGKIMYVSSPEGLRIRAEPSINSKITGINQYGQCIWLHERSDVKATINGITDYWYNSSNGSGGNGWVFGGYLIENLPPNVPIITGYWEIENSRFNVYDFSLDHRYWIGKKESGGGRGGTWELSKDTLILTEEFVEYDELSKPEIYRFNISVINNNRIILYSKNKDEIVLIRSTNKFAY